MDVWSRACRNCENPEKIENGIQKTFEVMTTNICSDGAYFMADKAVTVGTDVNMDN